MTQKIEIIADTLAGPHTIKINGHELTEVENIELYYEDGVMKCKMILLTDNFQLKRKPKLAQGGFVCLTKEPILV